MVILKNKLYGSAARLGRGFQTRPIYKQPRKLMTLFFSTSFVHLGNFVGVEVMYLHALFGIALLFENTLKVNALFLNNRNNILPETGCPLRKGRLNGNKTKRPQVETSLKYREGK